MLPTSRRASKGRCGPGWCCRSAAAHRIVSPSTGGRESGCAQAAVEIVPSCSLLDQDRTFRIADVEPTGGSDLVGPGVEDEDGGHELVAEPIGCAEVHEEPVAEPQLEPPLLA